MGWVSQYCSPTPPSLQLLISSTMVLLWARLLNVVLLPAVSSHRYRHLPWGLDQYSCPLYFSSVGGPVTHPCEAIHHLQGSFQPHYHNPNTPSHCHLAVTLHGGGGGFKCGHSPTALLPRPVVEYGASNPRMHRVSPDAICRTYGTAASFLGSPVAMSV
jgi:hypothetical protein